MHKCYFHGDCGCSLHSIGRIIIHTRHLFGTLSLFQDTLIYFYPMLNPFKSPCNNFFVVLVTNHVTSFEPKMLYLFNFF